LKNKVYSMNIDLCHLLWCHLRCWLYKRAQHILFLGRPEKLDDLDPPLINENLFHKIIRLFQYIQQFSPNQSMKRVPLPNDHDYCCNVCHTAAARGLQKCLSGPTLSKPRVGNPRAPG
jgi:hypothetical protein